MEHKKIFYYPIFFIGLFALLLLYGCGGSEQDDAPPLETLPMNELSLDDFSAFETVTDNWAIAGGVESDRTEEHSLNGTRGTGILVNIPDEDNSEHLFTSWKHGDLELELDFLMPKGSNSGIYLMGRYEVQLFDSWGVDEPQFSDVGGIYQRWDESQPEGEKGFEGSAPILNAARAPGLWQHLKILFKAPVFNESGEKVANAMFEEVWLNGVMIQENVEVSGSTRAAAFKNEQSEGPLMIQGDHGPVAVRNIKYKRYDKKRIDLQDLSYEYYAESLDEVPDFDTLSVTDSGSLDSLSGNVGGRNDRYGLRITGTLNAPNNGTYLFKLRNAGTSRMLLGGEVVFDQNRVFRMHELDSQTIELEAGTYPFIFEYIDHPNNWYSGLSLLTEGPQLRMQKLHSSNSLPGGGRELPDLPVRAEENVRIIRSFAMHNDSKRTHVVNVGDPNGINYNYDMGQAALLHAWEGPFINTNEMWINRGEPQIAKPDGPTITFDGKPVSMRLSGNNSAWPDSVSWDELRVRGYSILESGLPLFKYSIGNVEVEDYLEGTPEDRKLVRTIRFTAEEEQDNLWLHLASGSEILQTEHGYVIDDRSYYLNFTDSSNTTPEIVESEEGHDLRIPVLNTGTEAEFTYEIIW
ncbi:MAG: DUF1080 domain-containing protein [Balneolaceae bacterium]|nr:DUF1080 domain-containing protein [Balneolaceae bacterium]MDR9409781.1 DUF1080 domain-containing protein [Balneolaceae bacterium]